MRRRSLIVTAAGSAALAGLAGCAEAGATRAAASVAATGGTAPLPPSDFALVNRLTWGADSRSIAERRRGSRGDYLEGQLRPASTALPPDVQARIDALPLHKKTTQAWVLDLEQRRRAADVSGPDVDAKKAAQQAYQQALNQLARDAANETLLRALYAPNQLQEQLTWFWFNHFNVHQYKANLRAMVGDYQARLRERALGRFGDLLIASATHPAMIRYLDNQQNAAGRINENYAREVMELHTLGQGSGYTQRDVQELARVLTGLGVNFGETAVNLAPALRSYGVEKDGMLFNPVRHDPDSKVVLGHTIQPGGHYDEIVDQLTRLARHPATARHVTRKLAVAFVADDPPEALIGRMSGTFRATDGDIAAVLRTMFDAPEFEASLGRKFKDPVHYVISAVRLAYDGRTVLNTAPMQGWLNRLGEGLWNRQTPDGYPVVEAAWTGSGQLGTRFEIARAIGSGSAGLFRTEGAPSDAPAFPQLSNAVYHGELSTTLGSRTRAALDAAGSPQEWNALLLSSPEFMYR